MVIKNSKKNMEKEQEADRTNLEFLATVVHEIRNPLNAIIGISELLKLSPSEEERDEYVTRLIETCGNLKELINNIMDLGKLGSGYTDVTTEPTDLVDLIQQHVSGYKAIAESKGINFQIHKDERLPKWVLADHVKISQVILNLISNAVKFTKSGFITLGLLVEDLNSTKVIIQFSIKDSGIGIPQEQLKSIFEAYNQGGVEMNLKYGGTGLGLSISKEITKILGGELEVESRIGQGSEFKFSLELDLISELEIPPVSTPEIDSVREQNLKLLIVDDDKLNVLVLQKQLKYWGFDSKAAADGVSAVELVQQEEFDIILMDLHMPGLDGLSATEAIRELPGKVYKEIPIIGLSASTELFHQEKISSCRFTDLVSKPFSKEELLQKILLYGTRLQEDKTFSRSSCSSDFVES